MRVRRPEEGTLPLVRYKSIPNTLGKKMAVRCRPMSPDVTRPGAKRHFKGGFGGAGGARNLLARKLKAERLDKLLNIFWELNCYRNQGDVASPVPTE